MTSTAEPFGSSGVAGGGDGRCDEHVFMAWGRAGRWVALLGSSCVAVVAFAACSLGDEATQPDQPAEVPDGMVCEDWLRLPEGVRSAYADYRLSELRAADGIRYGSDPTTEEQIALMRRRMEAECRQDSLEVAQAWRVGHDIYVALFESGRLTD